MRNDWLVLAVTLIVKTPNLTDVKYLNFNIRVVFSTIVWVLPKTCK